MARPSTLVIAAAILLATPVAEAAAPREHWTTIVLPRFRIHYHEGIEHLAREVAGFAEPVLDQLVAIFGHEPEAPIHVVITDETDSANGFAFVLPQNIINLYPAVPEPLGTLGDYDDAMRLLFVHELTHIVHLDTIGGVASGVNAVFGKIYSPNQIQPRWFIEGIAVYAESRVTSAGRVRNALIDMFLREDVMADRFLTIDELTTSVRRFPGGTLQWDYGGRFLDFIATHYGEEVLSEISIEYGSRLIPYALNIVSGHATTKSYVDMWQEWKEDEERKTLAVLEKVDAEGLRNGDRFPWPAEEMYHPTFGPHGELAFVEAPRSKDGHLVILAPDLKTRLLTARTTGGTGAFSRDGTRWVGVISDSYEQRAQYSDLEIFDLESGERYRRTHGARLDDPDVSKDGTIIAVHQNASETALVTLSLDGDDFPEAFFVPAEGDQIFHPRWSPDGTRVAASLHHPDGSRTIVLVDRESGERLDLTNTRAHDVDPIFSPDGKRVIFSSDRGGVYNVYSIDLSDRTVKRLTNVVTGAIEPTIHPGGQTLAFLHGVFGGWEVRFFDLAGAEEKPLSVDPDPDRPVVTSTRTPSIYHEEHYTPWETLLPKTWSPNLAFDSENAVFGITLDGSDAIANHSYSLSIEYGTELDHLGYAFGYTNRTIPTPLFVTSALFSTRRPGSFVGELNQTRPETIFRLRGGVDIPLDRWDAGHGVGFSYGVELRRGPRIFSDDPFQTSPSVSDGDLTLASFGAFWRFSNIRAYADSISPAAGHALGLGIDIQDPRIGSDLRIITFSAAWNAYYTMPWLRNHVLATRFALGGAAGDARGRSVYVLGGLDARNIIADAIDGVRAPADSIRGYPQSITRGNSFYVLSTEYRFPIFELARGVYTLPAFVDRLHGALFVDAGDTPAIDLRLENIFVGVGGELRLEIVVGYYSPLTARLGIARGVTRDGITNPYFVLGGVF